MKHKLSRREFLDLMSLIVGAGLVSSCTKNEDRPTSGPTTPPTSTTTSSSSPIPTSQPTSTPLPIPIPEPISANIDLSAIYLHGRGIAEADQRTGYGYATVEPLYGEEQNLLTMMMDIKWAREHGISTFFMPTAYPDTTWERRLDEWFLAVNNPPFEIDYGLMFNPGPYLPWESSPYPLETGVVRVVREFMLRHVAHPRYKRLPDGRPVVFYYFAHMVAYFLGLDELENTADLLRDSFNEDIFLVGDVMESEYAVRTSPKYENADYMPRLIRPFDAISSYYLWRAGYEWNNFDEWNQVVTPFESMINGYHEACELWGEEAYKEGVKLFTPIAPTGVSNRLLYEAGLDDWVVDRHEGVSYETAKQMAEVGASFADPDLKLVLVGAWNECNEGAVVAPSKQFGFDPIHAVRDTFAIEPADGWPQDYDPSI